MPLRATHSMKGARSALVLNVLLPLMYTLPSRLVAVVDMAALSEPACGSVKPSVKGFLPSSAYSRTFFCWSSLPNVRMSSTSVEKLIQHRDG